MDKRVMASSGNVEFVQLQKQHLKEVLTFLEAYYYRDDNMCRAVGLSDVPEAVEEMNNICIKVAKCGVSLVALDKNTNRILGVALNNIYAKNEMEKAEELCKHPITMFIIDHLSEYYYGIFDRFNKNCILECFILCIHPDHRSSGIGYKLCELTLELATRLYRGENVKVSIEGGSLPLEPVPSLIFNMTTTRDSQMIEKRLGFTVLTRVPYDNIYFNGRSFASILQNDDQYITLSYLPLNPPAKL